MKIIAINWKDGRGRLRTYALNAHVSEEVPLVYERLIHEFLHANKSKRYRELPIFTLTEQEI